MARVGSGAALVAAIVFVATFARAAEAPPATDPAGAPLAADTRSGAPEGVPDAPAPGEGQDVPPPPALRPVPAAPAPLAAPAVAPLPGPSVPPVKRRYLYQRWPFWAVTGGLVIGMIALTYAATRPPPEPYWGSGGTFVIQ